MTSERPENISNPTAPDSKGTVSKGKVLGSKKELDLNSNKVKPPRIGASFTCDVMVEKKWNGLKRGMGLTDSQLTARIVKEYLGRLR